MTSARKSRSSNNPPRPTPGLRRNRHEYPPDAGGTKNHTGIFRLGGGRHFWFHSRPGVRARKTPPASSRWRRPVILAVLLAWSVALEWDRVAAYFAADDMMNLGI